MAKGDLLLFDAEPGYREDGVVSIDSDNWAIALLSDPVTALLVSESNPALGSANCNEVSPGGNYPSGGIDLTLNNSRANGIHKMVLDTGVHTSGIVSIAANAGNPTNVFTALLYSKTATSPADAAIGYIDLTENGGVTGIDLTGVTLNMTFGTGGNPGEICFFQTDNP